MLLPTLLCYQEEARTDVDFNVVMMDQGEMVEVQGGAEGSPLAGAALERLLALAVRGVQEILAVQREALQEPERH